MFYCGGKHMNGKELRRLRRKDLLEILLEQTRRIEELELELEKTKEKLNDKKVLLSNVGSLAEASLKLSDIFKAADEAIAIQIKNIEEMAKSEEKKRKKELREMKKKIISDGERKLKRGQIIRKKEETIPEVKEEVKEEVEDKKVITAKRKRRK